jgi:glutamate-ammonia-ligase adenylyltransferase
MTNDFPLISDKSAVNWQRLAQTAAVDTLTTEQQTQLQAILGLSDFISEHLITKPELLSPLLAALADPNVQVDYAAELEAALCGVADENELGVTLRVFRHTHMLIIAALDLLNLQNIKVSLIRSSELADVLINAAYEWLYTAFCDKYGTPQGEHGPQPLLILGMGKLGGKELNFSSDIDLIFCYPTSGELAEKRKPMEHQKFFTKLAQRLIFALNQTTQDGQVFRVDMRLRPLGESGPLVMNMDAFEDYYQEQGREWERYAMIKARVINAKDKAHQSEYVQELQAILRPFVFRRYIDYSAIDSLRKMKSLINQEVRRRGLVNNIKLGAGGIREVEFIAQSFQLIKGGRLRELQITSLIATLDALIEEDLLPLPIVQQLMESYLFLRKVEHSLQQFADQQTQELPDSPVDKARLCSVMQFANYADFKRKLTVHMQGINQQFQLLIGDTPVQEYSVDSEQLNDMRDAWQLSLSEDELAQIFKRYLPADLAQNFAVLTQDAHTQIMKKHPSSRALDTLNALVPQLLKHSIDMSLSEPDETDSAALLKRIIHILLCIVRRTTYLQLLLENQGAQQQLARLCYASPWIAQQISNHPILLDELLNPAQLYNPTPYDQYESELRQMLLRVEPDDLELQMETLRQFKQIQQLRIASADVTGALELMKVSDYLTYLAQAIIEEVVNMAWQQMAEKYGVPPDTSEYDKKFAVIGYGKLGGIELGYGSDLDLVFVHNADLNSQTQGPKSIETSQFYIRLAQRIMHLFMTKTPSGQLYEVDMRLRPSGNSGLLVSHVDSFDQYQHEQAWTWEHQALVRARVVYGLADLSQRIADIRASVLSLPRELADLRVSVAEMRQKMREHLNKGDHQWLDVKQDSGAIADIEFLVQFWVLANAKQATELANWSDNVRILEQLASLHIISDADKSTLINAYLDYRNESHRLTLKQKSNLIDKSQYAQHQQDVTTIWQRTLQI